MTRLILGRFFPSPREFLGKREETIIIPAASRVLCVSNGWLPLNIGPHKNAFYVTRPRPLRRVSPFSHRGANFFFSPLPSTLLRSYK